LLVKDKISLDKQGGLNITLKKFKSLSEQELETLRMTIIKQLKDSPSLAATNINIVFVDIARRGSKA